MKRDHDHKRGEPEQGLITERGGKIPPKRRKHCAGKSAKRTWHTRQRSDRTLKPAHCDKPVGDAYEQDENVREKLFFHGPPRTTKDGNHITDCVSTVSADIQRQYYLKHYIIFAVKSTVSVNAHKKYLFIYKKVYN